MNQQPSQYPFETAEDIESRRTKRRMALWSLFAMLAVDFGMLVAALLDPGLAATVLKLDSLVITVNGLVGGVVGAYMGFSFQAQWRNRSYFPGTSGMPYNPGSPYGSPHTGQPGASPYGR